MIQQNSKGGKTNLWCKATKVVSWMDWEWELIGSRRDSGNLFGLIFWWEFFFIFVVGMLITWVYVLVKYHRKIYAFYKTYILYYCKNTNIAFNLATFLFEMVWEMAIRKLLCVLRFSIRVNTRGPSYWGDTNSMYTYKHTGIIYTDIYSCMYAQCYGFLFSFVGIMRGGKGSYLFRSFLYF